MQGVQGSAWLLVGSHHRTVRDDLPPHHHHPIAPERQGPMGPDCDDYRCGLWTVAPDRPGEGLRHMLGGPWADRRRVEHGRGYRARYSYRAVGMGIGAGEGGRPVGLHGQAPF